MRNVGVFAHVDHGKTTLVERMLVYAAAIRRPGEVHDGNTTMDYLPQEMARGITINAAATTIPWAGHEINLIDTPGHIDFTAEVERSARVLDAAVVVVDAVSGVQAQTLRVWAQCERYGIPALVLINKMDRDGADFARALASLRSRLATAAAFVPANIPLILPGADRVFAGVSDPIALQTLTFGGEYGEVVAAADASADTRVLAARSALIDALMDADDAFVDVLLEHDGYEDDVARVPAAAMTAALAAEGAGDAAGAGAAYNPMEEGAGDEEDEEYEDGDDGGGAVKDGDSERKKAKLAR